MINFYQILSAIAIIAIAIPLIFFKGMIVNNKQNKILYLILFVIFIVNYFSFNGLHSVTNINTFKVWYIISFYVSAICGFLFLYKAIKRP